MNSFAKKLRKDSTDTEKLLWRYLRAKQISGLKFRRQEPIGKYIVDFVCFENRVLIECDGGQHMLQKDKDDQRDRWFIKQGFRVLRFWDNEILQQTKDVLKKIYEECIRTPSP